MRGANARPARFRGDPQLLPRIRHQLEALRAEGESSDAEDVAHALRHKHPEYSRRKFGDFLRMVRSGLEVIWEEGRPSPQPSDHGTSRNENASTPTERKRKLLRTSASAPVINLDDDSDVSDHDSGRYIENQDANYSNRSLAKLYSEKAKANVQENGTNGVRDGDGHSQSKLKRVKKNTAGDKSSSGSQHSRSRTAAALLDVAPERSSVTFCDLGGCEAQFLDVCRLSIHLKHPEIHERLGVLPPTGFLLHGPPGCGKTLFAQAVAGELDVPLLRVASTELVSGVSGESEEKVRALFARASECAPCVLLLDEIDAIAPKRESASREMERRIVSQLISCLDELHKVTSKVESPKMDTDEVALNENGDDGLRAPRKDSARSRGHVLVIGTTNRPDSIETALRRAGRFDKEIALGIPDERARTKIVEIVCRGIRLSDDVTAHRVARLTPGYVGADLKALAREASMCAVNRIFETVVQSQSGSKRLTPEETDRELQKMLTWLKSEEAADECKLSNLFVTMADFERALRIVHPSAKREGFATVPDVSWHDIGALHEVRDALQWSILYPIKRPEDFALFAMGETPQGILLCGPPGCGKTLLAKAVANETGMNFISVKGPELLSMYVGESERAVRTVFQRARDSSPCVIFFDEIDALCPKRSGNETSGSARLVNQLLTEMDGIESRKLVFLIGATNRPDIVDPAILRPGRLDKILFVDFPNASDRADILRKTTRDGRCPRVAADVSFETIAALPELEWFTGADLVALVREASVLALKERLSGEAPDLDAVGTAHFTAALQVVRPSVSERDRANYARLKLLYGKQS